MLSHAKLSESFWGEAVKPDVDKINLSPIVPLDGAILEEIWSGDKVSYNHLKVFDCRAFIHILKNERAKLDSNRVYLSRITKKRVLLPTLGSYK